MKKKKKEALINDNRTKSKLIEIYEILKMSMWIKMQTEVRNIQIIHLKMCEANFIHMVCVRLN